MIKTTIVILLMLCLIQRSFSRTQHPLYDSEANMAQLQKRFSRYSDDLAKLRDQVNKLKEQIRQNKGDSSLSVANIQQTIVNERDILFNIQSYLSLPFNYSLCDCYDFSDKQKAKLQEHINTLKQSLETLQRDASLEMKCMLMEEVKGEVGRQLQFVNGIEGILNSNCCTKRNKLTAGQSASGLADISRNQYQTNLKAKSWIYDGMTPSELRLRYFSRAASSNVTNCPIEIPYASGGECINCQENAPLWSMRLERCVGCPKGSRFNQTSKSCWKTEISSQSSESYAVVTPLRQTNVEVAPIKGKVIKKQITTRRRSTEKQLTEVLSPLRGKKIIKATTSRTSSRKSGSASSSTQDVVNPIRSNTFTNTKAGSRAMNSRTESAE